MARSDGDSEIVNGLDAVAALAREAVPPMTPLQRMRGFQAVMARTDARRRKRRSLFVALRISVCRRYPNRQRLPFLPRMCRRPPRSYSSHKEWRRRAGPDRRRIRRRGRRRAACLPSIL